MTTATESFRQNATDNLVVHKLPFDIIYFAHNSRRNGIANAEPERSPAAWLHRNVGHHSRCIFIYVYQVKYTQTHTHTQKYLPKHSHTHRERNAWNSHTKQVNALSGTFNCSIIIIAIIAPASDDYDDDNVIVAFRAPGQRTRDANVCVVSIFMCDCLCYSNIFCYNWLSWSTRILKQNNFTQN